MSRPSFFRGGASATADRGYNWRPRAQPIGNFSGYQPKHLDGNPIFCGYRRCERPPEPPPPPLVSLPPPPRPRPNFVVELRPSACGGRTSRSEFEALVAKYNLSPDTYVLVNSDCVTARLFYTQWHRTLEAMIALWELRLMDDAIKLTPFLIPNVVVPSDEDELQERLKALFVRKIMGLLECEAVQTCNKAVELITYDIATVSAPKNKFLNLDVFLALKAKQKALERDKDLIADRLAEFRAGMEAILDHLIGNHVKDGDEDPDNLGVKVFQFERRINWERIIHLIEREYTRLDQGLPIYSYRQKILSYIRSQQVMVLIGETGSGKSTQLVQFLADAGAFGDGAIICTQPRKIAAISLTERIKDESNKCLESCAISCYPSYLSNQIFYNGGVIFMTDHCLLQHCINNRDLSGVSCVIVDEAHERSLNTDLLLAMLKNLLCQRLELRLIIMSATADANQLSEYFFGCKTFEVAGRKFPVDIKYVPYEPEGTSNFSGAVPGKIAPYVTGVVRTATEIHKDETEGTILAFLTSQIEVEWACENFQAPGAIGLPLHGKLSKEEQLSVYQKYPGKRKVIFATNVAETSLTIPGVKFVVDSGMSKENRFEPCSGMSVLRVGWISKSSANQRAGRAGRTEPGQCYRLYSPADYGSMPAQQDPEIRRVHLGVAVLKILALGINDISKFDFLDAPCSESINMAIKNLILLGAVSINNNSIYLTKEGRSMVRLGVEPRLGKLILGCLNERLGREGLVLAAVMANSSSIFCRVGDYTEKLKSDCLKVHFCHPDGDLFTLLSVYKEWESVPCQKRNKWCWDNSINAKAMRRCQDNITELEHCLRTELQRIVPSYWLWKPDVVTEHHKVLKRVILSSLAENVAVYSGCDRLGYEVGLTGQHVQLHPSCSLLMFTQKPSWVVFGDVLSVSNQYLVCVTAFDSELLGTLSTSPPFDVERLENRRLQMKTLSGFGSCLLKRFCGKSNTDLHSLLSHIRESFGDERISIHVDVNNYEVQIFASLAHMEQVLDHVKNDLEQEKCWLQNECMEKCLYQGGSGSSPPVALFGAGAVIKHLELDKRCLSVDVYHSDGSSIDDKELVMLVRKYASAVCAVHKSTAPTAENEDITKWGSITFLTPDAAKSALMLNNVEFRGSLLKVSLSGATFGLDRVVSFRGVEAKVFWPRRVSKGLAIVKCRIDDVFSMCSDFSNLLIGGKLVRTVPGSKTPDSIVISGIDKAVSEPEILDALRNATARPILDFFLVRGDPVDNPPCSACEESLAREISLFMPKGSPFSNCCRVKVLPPEPKDVFMKAFITFDERLHLEAAIALGQIEGRVLPGFQSWQKIQCRRLFHSLLSCPYSVYLVLKDQLDSLIDRFNRQRGVECVLKRNNNGSLRVKISAHATKIVAELRRPLERLMTGTRLTHPDLTPTVLQHHLFSRDVRNLMWSLQKETGTYILFDRYAVNVKIFGQPEKVNLAEQRLISCLLTIHERKQNEIGLRGVHLPHDLMKSVVDKFGPDLRGLKEKVPDADYTLNTRLHVLSISGGEKDTKKRVEEIVNEVAQSSSNTACSAVTNRESDGFCPICLCEVEDEYKLENCGHSFCWQCLVDQCESARSGNSFPLTCAREKCGMPLLLADLKSLLSPEKLEELFHASLSAFVASSGGEYRFCPSPDCPSIYRVAGQGGSSAEPFMCGACFVETCTRCHVEYHPYLSCDKYREFKEDPDSSLNEWCKGRENVKRCPACGYKIEKVEGCNHVQCRCERHLCWVCLEHFSTGDDCYQHLRDVHQGII